jgi:starch phosphorylase
MFVFGLRAADVQQIKLLGYDPRLYFDGDLMLKRVVEAIAAGEFSPGEPHRYRAITDDLLRRDSYLLMADFASYVQAQAKVDALFALPAAWAERAALNIAGMGSFSADRTIREYIERVWMPRDR